MITQINTMTLKILNFFYWIKASKSLACKVGRDGTVRLELFVRFKTRGHGFGL